MPRPERRREASGELLLHGEGDEPVPVEPDPNFDKRGHFLDCIEHGAESLADAEWGRTVMTVADAIIHSAGSGEAVRLGE